MKNKLRPDIDGSKAVSWLQKPQSSASINGIMDRQISPFRYWTSSDAPACLTNYSQCNLRLSSHNYKLIFMDIVSLFYIVNLVLFKIANNKHMICFPMGHKHEQYARHMEWSWSVQ